jgi:hypothetical protein
MIKHCLLLFVPFLFFLEKGQSQKVKRQGTQPINNTKKNTDNIQKYSIEQFYGRWQEIKRSTKNNTGVQINDTIYLNFTSPNKVETRDGTKNIMRGEALIEDGNFLIAAADIYSIISVSPEEIILDNQEDYIHILRKKDVFLFETYGKDSVRKEVYHQLTTFTLADITGNWKVYRKSAKPGREIKAVTDWLISINIFAAGEKDSGTGEVEYLLQSSKEKKLCSVTIENGKLILKPKDGNEIWSFRVYKADGKEFIFGEAGDLIFYSKLISL